MTAKGVVPVRVHRIQRDLDVPDPASTISATRSAVSVVPLLAIVVCMP
jgi:hypothetical protein